MLAENLRRLANALGIENPHCMKISDLIHSIRFLEGELPCFSQAWSAPCQIGDCPHCLACSSSFC
jgi:hypothetical protein